MRVTSMWSAYMYMRAHLQQVVILRAPLLLPGTIHTKNTMCTMPTKSVVFFVVLGLVFQLGTCRPANSNETGPDGQNPQTMCKLPAYRGHCRALIPRWRYDPDTGKCQEFKFGGCDGNGNNFATYKACMTICGSH